MKSIVHVFVCVVLLGPFFESSGAMAQADITRSTMLARVADDTITVYDLVLSAWTQRLLKPVPTQLPEKKMRDLLEDLIFDALLEQEADVIDLSREWSYQTRERAVLSQMAAQIFQNEEFLFRLNIDSAAVDSYYHAHIDRFTVPRPQRHLRQITVYKENFGIPEWYLEPIDTLYVGWDPKRKIDSLYERLRNGESFTSLAAMYSEEPRARTLYGDWGWISKDGLADSTLARIVFEQPLHRISKPIELPYGWVIVQVLGEREAGTTPFDATVVSIVQSWMLQELGTNLAKKLVDSLLAVAEIEYIDETIAKEDTLIDAGAPLAIINDRDTVRGADYFYYRNNNPEFVGRRVIPESDRRTIIDQIIRNLTFYAALREWGYLDRPEVQQLRHDQRVMHVKDMIKVELSRDLTPDSAEIVNYYNTHLREFTPDRRHFIFQRVFGDLDSANAVAAEWRGGSPPENAEARWVKSDDLPTPVWNRVAAVTEGSVVGPITVKDQHWVVFLDRIGQAKPLGSVRGQIIARLRDAKHDARRAAWIRDASRRYPVERRLDVLSRLVLPSREEANLEWFPDVLQAMQGSQ
ncbi:MAG: hypothetical protein Kow0074_05130 [Candidatus Zixiibacteriota bacterium]